MHTLQIGRLFSGVEAILTQRLLQGGQLWIYVAVLYLRTLVSWGLRWPERKDCRRPSSLAMRGLCKCRVGR